MTTRDEHPMELHYYNTDDGIWLKCTRCRVEANLDFWPSPEDVAYVAQVHLDDAERQ